MRKFILLYVVILFAASCGDAQKKITTFVLLRHAEKGNDGTDDPDLNPEGVERAARLVQILMYFASVDIRQFAAVAVSHTADQH